MLIHLDRPAAERVWPEEIVVRTFRPGGEGVFYDVRLESSRDHWEPREPSYEEALT
jgi:hypothetical protein